MKNGAKKMILGFAIGIGLLIALIVTLAIISPGKSMSEKLFLPIGGVEQGMFIRSKNFQNPVLLYVHGGPAFPNYFLIEKYKPGLEDYFTVCYWEQRGGGLSYTPAVKIESMTLDQLSSDLIEVSNYLRERFGKEQIYLLAHSGGTPIALSAASQAPQLFKAYIAMAQISRQSESERIAYHYLWKQFIEKKDHRSVKELKKFRDLQTDADILSFHSSLIRDKAMHKSGIGTMRQMHSIFWGVFVPVWTCRAYTLKEKINIWKSKIFFLPKTNLKKEILSTDYTQTIPNLDLPVYFISGKYDLTVNVKLSREYYDKLHAPLKGFYTFENSAHSPIFEEAERFRLILEKDILKAEINLSDK